MGMIKDYCDRCKKVFDINLLVDVHPNMFCNECELKTYNQLEKRRG